MSIICIPQTKLDNLVKKFVDDNKLRKLIGYGAHEVVRVFEEFFS